MALDHDTFYCVKEKKRVHVPAGSIHKTSVAGRGGRSQNALTAVCPSCGTKLFKFVAS